MTTPTMITPSLAQTDAINFVYRALRSSWRRGPKAGVIRALRDEVWTATGGHRRTFASATDRVDTACWSLEERGGGVTRHHIQLGEKAPLSIDTPAKDSRRLILAFLRQLLRHETAHARFTLRRADGTELAFPDVQSAVATAGIPWSLWNLFEDCRIEYLERVRSSGETFNWRKWWQMTDTDDPTRYLWIVCQNEGPVHGRTAQWTGASTTLHPDTGKRWDTRDLITHFWSRACRAADVLALIPLMQEWMRVFGATVDVTLPTFRDAPPSVSGSGTPAGGPATGAGGGTGYSDRSAEGNSSPAAPTAYGAGYATSEQEYRDMASDLAWFGNQRQKGALNRQDPRYMPTDYSQRVQSVVSTFRRLQGIRDSVRQQVSQSGSRLHFRNVICGEPNSFRSTSQRHGKRRVVLVMDMSGSMSDSFQEHGAAFLEAMQTLRRQRQLDCTIILSGGGRNAIVPPNCPADLLSRLAARHGCESIRQTLDTHRDLLIAADTVLIYTDGNLTDGKVNAGHWRSLGVDLVGVCTNEHEQAYLRTEMEENFSRAILAPNGHQLATQILDYVTRH